MKIKTERINRIEILEALNIYNHYIENSLSNFEEKKISIKSFVSLYKSLKKKKLPFLIAKKNNETIGVAFVNSFRDKSGYRFTHEHSIYVSPKHLNYGHGSMILEKLLKECKKNKNIKNLIAVIGGSDNVSSIKIHEKNGFKKVGILKKVGFKKNKWIDSLYLQRKI